MGRKKLTCYQLCQLINLAQEKLSKFSPQFLGIPETQESYLTTFNSAICAGQGGLSQIGNKTCDSKCCKLASEAIVQIISDFLFILDQINTKLSDPNRIEKLYQCFLTLLERSIKEIVQSTRDLKCCCIETGRVQAKFSCERQLIELQIKEDQNLATLTQGCQSVQGAFNKIYNLDISFKCCVQLTKDLIALQTDFINYFNPPILNKENVQTFGDNSNLSIPTGIAIRGDLAYVTDSGTKDYVAIFDTTNGDFVTSFGIGSYNGITIDDNLVYVVDISSDLVEVYDLGSDPINPPMILSFGAGYLNDPTGIAIRGNLAYVTDFNEDQVVVFDKTDGTFLGNFGAGNYQCIAIDGNLAYVVDNFLKSVQVFNLGPDPINPLLTLTFGDITNLVGPDGISIRGKFAYIADSYFDYVAVFDRITGEFVTSFGNGNYSGVTIDGDLLYVIDFSVKQVEVFNLSPDLSAQQELDLFQSIVKQLVNPCQVAQDPKCCLSPLLQNIYLQYTESFLVVENSLFRQFTSCVYRELLHLQETLIKQTDCCEKSILAIQSSYSAAIIRFRQIINNIPNPDQDQQLFQSGQVTLNQIKQIIGVLLSNKCLDESSSYKDNVICHKDNITCCESINLGQANLTQISYIIPSDFEPYLCAVNSGLIAAQEGLSKLLSKTCDPQCCKLISQIIVQITQSYINTLNQLSQENSFQKFNQLLKLLKKTIKIVVQSVKNPKTCCIESGRAQSRFQFQLDLQLVQNELDRKTLKVIFNIIQNGFDQLAKVKLSFECCAEAAQALIGLQNSFSCIESKGVLSPNGFTIGDSVDKDMADTSVPELPSAFAPGPTIPDSSDTASRWTDWGGDIFDEWGFFYLFDPLSQQYAFPLITPQNQPDGQIFTQLFSAFGRNFTIKQGYPVQGIFKFEITVDDNQPFIFGAYGSMGSDGSTLNTNLTQDYTLGGQDLTLFYNFNQNVFAPTERFYSYFVPCQLSQNESKTYSDFVYGGGSLSLFSVPVSFGLTVYFAKTNDVKDWVINDLQISVNSTQLSTLTASDILLLKLVVNQLTQKKQVKNKCCFGELFLNIFEQYIGAINQVESEVETQIRKFTACVYEELDQLQKNRIKQPDCCEPSFGAILQTYIGALNKILTIVNQGLPQTSITQTIQLALTQIESIIQTLLSNKCVDC